MSQVSNVDLKIFGGLRYRAKISDVLNFPVERELNLDFGPFSQFKFSHKRSFI